MAQNNLLKFQSWKIFLISTICFLGVIFSIPNFFNSDRFGENPFLFGKQINLGLDLQGGSYILLQANVSSVFNERLENIDNESRTLLKKDNIEIIFSDISNEVLTLKISDSENLNFSKNILIKKFTNEFNVSIINDEIQIIFSEQARVKLIDLTIAQAIEIVRRRIDETGTKEPLIQRQGKDRILIQLPGVDDPERIKSLLGKTAKLTFQLVDTNYIASDILNSGRTPPGTKLLQSLNNEGEYFVVKRRVMVSGEMLTDAMPSFDQNSRPSVSFSLTTEGGKRFGKVTSSNIGKPFAIILDDKVVSAPVIQSQIFSSGQITGNFTVQDTKDLALLLRAGALPAPLDVIQERSVGPGLGKDSVQSGKLSVIIGFIFVILFMFLTYGIFGLMANIALLFNIFLIIGILSLIQATLTLPGIAGIVLTMGMAVDANVLIFERIREEAKLSDKVLSSIESGYQRAIGTIIDANITTLIAAGCLYALGSGPIKGFAVTLSIGIMTSLFTSIMVTRMFVVFYLKKSKTQRLYI